MDDIIRSMTKIKIISDDAGLVQACRAIQNEKWIALDTEFMREKTFSPILCLIQISTGIHSFCIDPLPIENLGPLSDLLASQSSEKILHSCRQDFEALDSRFPLAVNSLFDTQVAAAFCGQGDQLSYAAVVERVTEVKLAKSHTRANWLARPLSDDELNYALDDVLYLQPVREYFARKLEQLDRLAWFEEECRRQTVPANWRADPDTAWTRLKGAARLDPEAHCVARELATWREREAVRRNLPREWVLKSGLLLEISRLNPDSRSDLQRIDGLNSGTIKKYADVILGICHSTPRDPAASPLWSSPRMLDPEQKRRLKGVMAMLKQTSEDLGISTSLLANRNSVERFVAGKLDLELFRGWRHEVVGEKVLQSYS